MKHLTSTGTVTSELYLTGCKTRQAKHRCHVSKWVLIRIRNCIVWIGPAIKQTEADSIRNILHKHHNIDTQEQQIPGSWRSGKHKLECESTEWWQKPTRQVKFKQCAQCEVVKEFVWDFHAKQRGRGGIKEVTGKRICNHISHWMAWFSLMWIWGMLVDYTTSKATTLLCRWWLIVESQRRNNLQCRIDRRVSMVVNHIGANGLSLEIGRWRSGWGESRVFRQ